MRSQCVTGKIVTAFGTLYAHLEVDGSGKPTGLHISTPGKSDNTELDNVIRTIVKEADALIKEVA